MAQQTENVDFRLSATDGASAVFAQAQRGLDGLAKQALDAKTILGTLGAAVTAQQFASMILSTTETIAKYKDLGIVAGTTAANISAMEEPARLAGISLDSVAQSVAKLGQSIGEARLGDVGKRNLLTALGIDPDDGRDAAEVYVDVARAVSGMSDQTIAAKVSNDLLGKSYREVRVFLQELTEQGELHSRITNEQAEAADHFRDNLARTSVSLDQAKISLANELLPLLNQLAQAFADNRKEMESFPSAAAGVKTVFETLIVLGSDVAFTFKIVGMEIGALAATIAAAARLDFKAVLSIQREVVADAEKSRAALEAFQARILAASKAAAEAREAFDQAGKGPAAGNEAERLIRERMEFEKHYGERVAAAQGFYKRYADAIATGNQLAQEAGRQGLLKDFELIRQTAANEDARLQVLILALNEERALHLQMGDLKQARIAQERAAAAESMRIANEAITQARLTSLDAARDQKAADEEAKFRRDLAQKVANIQIENMTELELLNMQLVQKQEQIDAAEQMRLISADEANRQRELLELQHQARMGNATAQGMLERRRIEQMGMTQQAQFYFGQLASITAAGAQHNRTMFNLNKAAGIANAIMSTAQGAAKALEWGFPLGPIFAAIITAAGLVQINTIRQAKFGEGSSAPSIGGGTAIPITPAEGTPATPVQQIGLPQAAAPRTQINLTVVGNENKSIDYKTVTEELVPLLNEALANGADVRLMLA